VPWIRCEPTRVSAGFCRGSASNSCEFTPINRREHALAEIVAMVDILSHTSGRNLRYVRANSSLDVRR